MYIYIVRKCNKNSFLAEHYNDIPKKDPVSGSVLSKPDPQYRFTRPGGVEGDKWISG